MHSQCTVSKRVVEKEKEKRQEESLSRGQLPRARHRELRTNPTGRTTNKHWGDGGGGHSERELVYSECSK